MVVFDDKVRGINVSIEADGFRYRFRKTANARRTVSRRNASPVRVRLYTASVRLRRHNRIASSARPSLVARRQLVSLTYRDRFRLSFYFFTKILFSFPVSPFFTRFSDNMQKTTKPSQPGKTTAPTPTPATPAKPTPPPAKTTQKTTPAKTTDNKRYYP